MTAPFTLDLTSQATGRLRTVLDLLAAKGIDARVQQYHRGQCSCCYFPDWGENERRVLFDTYYAPNHGSYPGEKIRLDGTLANAPLYIRFEGADDADKAEVGRALAVALAFAGYLVSWNESTISGVQILGIAPEAGLWPTGGD